MEALVGRDAELARLQQYAQEAARGAGRLVLVSGNTGVGKTSLVTAALARGRIFAIFCAANPLATAPLGPLVDALRKMEREGLFDLRGAASRIAALKHILPELGDASEPADRAGLIAALCDVMTESVHERPLAVVLDDLQWADHATLELLPMLAERSHDARLLIIGIYSSDAVTGSHPIRALRDSLRRARRLSEIPLSPLDEEGVRALAEKSVGAPVDAPTARRLFSATGGVPFFVEALAHSLLGDHPQASSSKERVRDAIAARFDRLCHDARLAAEAGAALGTEFALGHAASITGSDSGFEELLRSGLLVELTPGIATFRPGLVRDALYDLIPWTRRRLIHRAAAELLEREGHVHQAAGHWQACGELIRAREVFLQAAERSRRLHAHRDAAAALRQALDQWTRGDDEAKRLSALDIFADASLLAGGTADALTAWREIIDSSAGQPSILARAHRKIANVHEMNCEWARGLAARQDAQAAFVAAGEHAEAAIEGLTAALRLRQLARHGPGIEVLVRAAVDAEKSGRKDLQVRVAALRANLEVRLGKIGEGIPAIRAALEAALALDEPVLAGEIYQRLADAIERSGDYEYATKVNLEGISYCEQRKAPPGILACLACMSWILIRSGEWEHAASASRRMAEDFCKNPVGGQ